MPDTEEGRQARLANAQTKSVKIGPGFLVEHDGTQMLGSAAKSEIEITVRSMMLRQRRARPHVGPARHGGPPRSNFPASLCDCPSPDLSRTDDKLIPPADSEAMHALIPTADWLSFPTQDICPTSTKQTLSIKWCASFTSSRLKRSSSFDQCFTFDSVAARNFILTAPRVSFTM